MSATAAAFVGLTVYQVSVYQVSISHSDTWWTVVLTEAAAVAEHQQKQWIQRLYFDEFVNLLHKKLQADLVEIFRECLAEPGPTLRW